MTKKSWSDIPTSYIYLKIRPNVTTTTLYSTKDGPIPKKLDAWAERVIGSERKYKEWQMVFDWY